MTKRAAAQQASAPFRTRCRIAMCYERNKKDDTAILLGHYTSLEGNRVQAFPPHTAPVEVPGKTHVYRCEVCDFLFGYYYPREWLILMHQRKTPEEQQGEFGVFHPEEI